MRNDFKTRLIRYKAYSKLSMYKEAIEELKSAMEIRTSKEMQLHLENTKFRYVEALETQEKMSNAYNFVLHIPKLLASTSFPIKVINIMFFILINFIKRNKFLFTFVSIVGVVTLIYEISKNLHKVLYVKF